MQVATVTAAGVALPHSGVAAAQPKRGGILKCAKVGDIASKNMHALAANNYLMTALAWDTPTRFDAEVKPQPWLAEAWEWSKDSLALTLKVRKGIKFHSGRELTAEDFKFNLERVRRPEVASQMRQGSEKIKDIVIADPYTITLKFEEPNPAIWDTLETLYITDKNDVDNRDAKVITGTGPFRWVEWRPGDRLIFERNPNYWVPGLPLLDRIEISVMKDVSSMPLALEAGAVDLIEQPLERDFVRFRDGGKFQALASPFWSEFYYLGSVVNIPPLDNKKLRQAINYSIDRQRFVEKALVGIGEAHSIPWPKNSPAFEADLVKSYKYDLDKAKKLVQESGVSNPAVTIVTSGTTSPNWVTLAEIVQADLSKVGFTAKIEILEFTVWRDRLVNRKMQSLWTGQFAYSHMHPSSMATLAFPWRVGNNTSNFGAPEYARLNKLAGVTMDPAEAKKVYRQLTELILEESFMMPVSPNLRTWVLAPHVKEFTIGEGGYVYQEKTWLDK
jgi:peptide/nickel transport system substrate-binding protein